LRPIEGDVFVHKFDFSSFFKYDADEIGEKIELKKRIKLSTLSTLQRRNYMSTLGF